MPVFKPIEQCSTVDRIFSTEDLREAVGAPAAKADDLASGDGISLPATLNSSRGEMFQGPICLYGSERASVHVCYNRWRGQDNVSGYNYPAVSSTMYGQGEPGHAIYRMFHQTSYDGSAVIDGQTREPRFSRDGGRGCYGINYGFDRNGVSLDGTYNYCPDRLTTNYAQNLHSTEWYSGFRPNMIRSGESYAYDTTHQTQVRDGLNSGINFTGSYSTVPD